MATSHQIETRNTAHFRHDYASDQADLRRLYEQAKVDQFLKLMTGVKKGDTGNDKDNDVIVATIIGMAHSLNLRVTAEGVESLGQLNTLKRLGCDAYQGFLFSRAMPGDEFAAQFLAPQHLNFGV